MLDFISTTPLHYMLGLTVEIINTLEWELQQLDAKLRKKALDEKLAEALEQLSSAMDTVTVADLERWEAEVHEHRNCIHVIEQTASTEAIARGKKRANRSRDYQPLPLEAEYRLHTAKLRAAERQVEKSNALIDSIWRKSVRVSADEPGPFAQSFLDAMDKYNFQRQAYHSGALVGNDCEKVLQPEVAEALSSLLRPRLVAIAPTMDAYHEGGTGPPYVIIGSNTRADAYAQLLADFGVLVSLFMRKAPLCSHEIELFERTVTRYATLYADMFPYKEPPPKMHGLCYHMAQQMRRLGGTGFLSESVVEAMHVVDNRMVARYACVKNLEEQLRCRARAIWQLCHTCRAKHFRFRIQNLLPLLQQFVSFWL
eukprot:6214069-Pleurochrysis_carterae.AAC.5